MFENVNEIHSTGHKDVPDRRGCLALLEAYQVPEHIVGHSLRVAQVSLVLGQLLFERGLPLNLLLIEAGALLHDITKMSSLQQGQNHALSGAQVLDRLGYPRVAEIVRQHIYPDLETPGTITEAQVVFYADKRVQHERIVSLGDRLRDLIARYGGTPERDARMETMNRQTRILENRIFAQLPFDPAHLNRLNNQPADDISLVSS